MTAPPLKRNKYFQTAVLDPASTMSVAEYTTYLTSTPLHLPAGTIKVIVGSSPAQRVWYLPKPLLTRHSTHLASLCASTSITLSEIDPHAFANFVDYMRSSIYTLNPQSSSYHPLRSHIDAALLGEILDAHTYTDAAISKLHMSFEPAAKLASKTMHKCPITPDILEYVFSRTEDTDMSLRTLVCDAVAASWKRKEVYYLTINQIDDWKDVYEKYELFKKTMQKSLRILDRQREGLLKPVDKYLRKTGNVKAKKGDMRVKKEVVSDSEDEGQRRERSGPVAEQRRKILVPRIRFPGVRRSVSEERRKVQRAEVEERDAEIEEWSAGIKPEEGGGGEEAGAPEDLTLVDQDRVEDVAEHEFA